MLPDRFLLRLGTRLPSNMRFYQPVECKVRGWLYIFCICLLVCASQLSHAQIITSHTLLLCDCTLVDLSRLQCGMAENQRVNSQTAEESRSKFWPAVTAVTIEIYRSDTPQVVSTHCSVPYTRPQFCNVSACWKHGGSLYAGSDILSLEYAPSSGATSRCWT